LRRPQRTDGIRKYIYTCTSRCVCVCVCRNRYVCPLFRIIRSGPKQKVVPVESEKNPNYCAGGWGKTKTTLLININIPGRSLYALCKYAYLYNNNNNNNNRNERTFPTFIGFADAVVLLLRKNCLRRTRQ